MLLDDEEDFLHSYRGLLSLDHAVVAYSSVENALKYVRNSQTVTMRTFDLFSKHSSFAEPDGGRIGDQTVMIKSSLLHDLAFSPKRYRLPSVLIVDEVMPEARGLEICHMLQDTGIKTILLSGQLTTDKVLNAFNGKKMDRYISKSDPLAFAKVEAAIHELQLEYFRDKLNPMSSAIQVSRCHDFTNEQLTELFDLVFEDFPFVEYYYHSRSGGYILRNVQGETRVLLFADRIELFELADIIADNTGECATSLGLRKGNLVAWELFDDFEDGRTWDQRLEELVFPAEHLDELCWTLVKEEDIPYKRKTRSSSWQDYRKQLMSYPINWTEAA